MKCLPCKGTGQVPAYLRGDPILDAKGKVVGYAKVMVNKTCSVCKGTGRDR